MQIVTVHPHGCGEHFPGTNRNTRPIGSSPRVWGTQRDRKSRLRKLRFIPTGVGNTEFNELIYSATKVHPHGCGEHGTVTGTFKEGDGSSPRVWGTLNFPWGFSHGNRFIPTGVGNTILAPTHAATAAVHPHGCGEHGGKTRNNRDPGGSSPRVWGTQSRKRFLLVARRFIPTGVGNTVTLGRGVLSEAVHPHGCGEHQRRAFSTATMFGSSPRVWGTLFGQDHQSARKRFIPTGVGNTSTKSKPWPIQSVHPHGCGEHWLIDANEFCKDGSSPRVWGTRHLSLSRSATRWFIPTGVGNTDVATEQGATFSVHPHGCGEHTQKHCMMPLYNGSSPRVWGTPRHM